MDACCTKTCRGPTRRDEPNVCYPEDETPEPNVCYPDDDTTTDPTAYISGQSDDSYAYARAPVDAPLETSYDDTSFDSVG